MVTIYTYIVHVTSQRYFEQCHMRERERERERERGRTRILSPLLGVQLYSEQNHINMY